VEKIERKFYIDIDLIDKLRLRYKTNILILTDPVYSCGKSLDDNDFSQLIDYCMYHGIWIVVDMAFGGLSWSDENIIWVDINKWTRNNYQKL
jgi:bifunctional pyridoxal-dependent enzyme with beta-cystathionase and maltose regulon repressor activities